MVLDHADVKASVYNLLVVGILAMLFILLGKWLFVSRFNLPGVSAAFAAV